MSDDRDVGMVVERWLTRLRERVPGTVAIVLKGSAARGHRSRWSDIDFEVLTSVDAGQWYLMLVDIDDGMLWHISAGVTELGAWLHEPDEPASWTFGLPAEEAFRLVWATDADIAATVRAHVRHFPPDLVEMEDTIEGYRKLRAAQAAGDDFGVRLAAHDLALLCPGLLVPLNPPVRPGTRRQALDAALGFHVAPPHYRDDVLTCLGWTGRAVSTDELALASRRLVSGIFGLVRAHRETYRPLLSDDLFAILDANQVPLLLADGDVAD